MVKSERRNLKCKENVWAQHDLTDLPFDKIGWSFNSCNDNEEKVIKSAYLEKRIDYQVYGKLIDQEELYSNKTVHRDVQYGHVERYLVHHTAKMHQWPHVISHCYGTI